MKICVQKSTGKFLEMQSFATDGTLIQNAINAGFDANDLKEQIITEEQFKAISNTFETQNTSSLADQILSNPTELAKLKQALGL